MRLDVSAIDFVKVVDGVQHFTQAVNERIQVRTSSCAKPMSM